MNEENHSLMTLKSPRFQHFFLFVKTTKCKFSTKWKKDKNTFFVLNIIFFFLLVVESVKRKH